VNEPATAGREIGETGATALPGSDCTSAPPQKLPTGLWYVAESPFWVSVTLIQYSTSDRPP
jgi:hypothetical protein